MDFLEDILGARTQELVKAVVDKSELGREEAETFVPEAGRSVAKALAGSAGQLDLSSLASQANVNTLLSKIDIGALAGAAGLTRERGASGLSALLPVLLRFIGDNDGAMGMLSGLAKAEGGLDTLKKLGGKLFG